MPPLFRPLAPLAALLTGLVGCGATLAQTAPDKQAAPPDVTVLSVDRDQSIELDKKLTEANVPHQLILIPGIGHTFDLENWGKKPLPQDLRPVVIGFLDKHLKSGTKPTGP